MWFLAVLSILGLLMDLTVHIAALLGFNPQDWIQPEWLAETIFYGTGLTLLVVFAIVSTVREKRAKARGIVLPFNAEPLWFYVLIRVVMVYGVAGGAIWMLFQDRGGIPVQPAPGVYALDPGHGHPIERVSFEEYCRVRRNGTRSLSGIFLIWYSVIAFDFTYLAMGKEPGIGQGPTRRIPGRRIFVIWRRY
jgi:hypothetical protein